MYFHVKRVIGQFDRTLARSVSPAAPLSPLPCPRRWGTPNQGASMFHVIAVLWMLTVPSMAMADPPQPRPGNSEFGHSHKQHGAPGPLALAGIPGLIVAGYGVWYWLRKRRDDREMWY